MDSTTCVLTQKRFLRGRQTLTLDGDKLKVEYQRGLSLQEYRFDLRGLLPDPTRIRQVPLVRIAGLIFLGLVSLFLLPFGIAAEAAGMGTRMGGLSAIGLLLLVAVSVAWIPTLRQCVNVLVLEGPGGRLVLWPDRPNKEEFDEFLRVLIARIDRVEDRGGSLVRRLRQAGIIDDWQYDQALELLERKKDHPETR
jgi:hypothetical protein